MSLRSLAAPCLLSLAVACSIDSKHYAADASPDASPDPAPGTATDAGADGATDDGRTRVAYVGDSIAHETAAVLEYELTLPGSIDFTAATAPRLALCDFFPETEDTDRSKQSPVPDLEALVRSTHPDAIVLQFWGNSTDHTPCMKDDSGHVLEPGTLAYYQRYRADALRATEIIRAAAAGGPDPIIFWVLQGPDRELLERPLRLNENFAAVATQTGAHTIDAGQPISKAADPNNPGGRYEWVQWLPCNEHEVTTGHCLPFYGGIVQIHKDDKTPELCLGKVEDGECAPWSPGVFRYGRAIAEAVRAAL